MHPRYEENSLCMYLIFHYIEYKLLTERVTFCHQITAFLRIQDGINSNVDTASVFTKVK